MVVIRDAVQRVVLAQARRAGVQRGPLAVDGKRQGGEAEVLARHGLQHAQRLHLRVRQRLGQSAFTPELVKRLEALGG